jgi:uncharacterized protein (DUF362 family)
MSIMKETNRRDFVKTFAVASFLGLTAGSHPKHASSAENPAMCIARYKSSPKEPDAIVEEAERLTRTAVNGIGGMSRFVSKGEIVWVKPNICFERLPEQAVNSNPHVVATVIKLCYEAGAKQVLVSNNPTGDLSQAFKRSGISEEAEKAGGKVLFMDRRKFKRMAINGKVIKEWEVYTEAVEADKLISIATVKHHPLSTVTLGMKGLMGLITGPRDEFHNDFDNSIPDLAAFLKPDLVVLDAIRVLMRNGPFGGNLSDVERKDTIAISADQIAVDAFGATLLNQKPSDIGYIKEGASRGMGEMDFNSRSPVRLDL